ncbi:SusC/RagA family TonB-linked outer membrane protein [Geofilum sp. OHC36d9]|uniref:SusC/RagA family TonB-linked outer membrane protein n=1 Tax=Geofilum sp. OHC36d9 TaxID=3458413 RepID=UPI0040336FE5
MKKSIFKCFVFVATLMLSSAVLAQTTKSISGKVSDSQGLPLPGVNVIISGTTNGTITNADGEFSLNVSNAEKASLTFSFIGFKELTVPIGSQTILSVVLDESFINLDEVVAVGYGVMRKSDLTGSVGSVESEKLTAKGSTTVMESLQGQVAGVDISQSSSRPGDGFKIQIRGKSSLQGGEPLYVVDGIITDNINFLNPSDIEKIDILKDASSTAIYGSRATNGVVLVTTKSAKPGSGKKFTVTYDGYYGTKKVARMPDFMDGREWAAYRFMRYTDTTINPDGSVTRSITDGSIANVWAGNSDTMKEMYRNEDFIDWRDLMLTEGTQQNHYLNIAGNTDNISYHMGIGRQEEDGILGDKYDRTNVKAVINSELNEKFTTGISINLAVTNQDYGSQNSVINSFRVNDYWLPYDENGELNYQPGKDARYPTGFSSTVSPLVDRLNSADETRTYNILTNIYLQYSPIKGLNLKTTFSPSYMHSKRGQWYGPDAEVNSKTRTHQSTITNKENFSYTWDNQLEYAKTFNDHNINLLGVVSMYSSEYQDDGLTGIDFPFATEWYNLGAAASIQDPNSSYSKITMLSYILRANYSFKNKYLATISSRWDGSSKFSEDNKWGAFPSMALAWRLNEESFIKDNLAWLSNLKTRVSYGVSGNNASIGAYTTQPLASTKYWYSFNQELAGGYGPSNFVNEDLTWEKTKEFNVGLDYGIFNNRVNGSIDWYNRTSEDLLMEQKIPVEMGALGGTMWNNVGKVKNTGIELMLNTLNVKTSNFRWETSFTFSKNKNEILELNGKKEDIVANKWFIGQPIDVMYELEYDGITTAQDLANDPSLYTTYGFYEGSMKIVNQNDDNVIDSDDRIIQGHALPDWTGSFNSNMTYKNIDFSFSIYTKQGSTVASPFMAEFTDYSDRGRTKLSMDFYVPEGNPTLGGLNSDGSTIINTAGQMGSYPYPDNDRPNHHGGGYGWGTGKHKELYTNQYVDASFVKVKNITIGYTMPQKWMEQIKIAHMRVYCNVLNPFTFTDYKGFDPEWADASLTDGTGGPSSITYQFGVNLKF